MEPSWGASFVKHLLYAFNVLLALSGVAIIAVGAVTLSDVTRHEHFVEGRALAPPVVLIVAGCIVFLVAALGCCGAMRESKLLLFAFAAALLVIFVLELAAGAAAAAYRSDLEEALRGQLRTSMANYTRSMAAREAWDGAQRTLHCCGLDGPKDWLGDDNPERGLPVSCCHATREGSDPPTEAQCRVAQPTDIYVYQDGCAAKLQDTLRSSATLLIGVGIGVAFLQVLGIALACWLAAAVGRDGRASSAADK